MSAYIKDPKVYTSLEKSIFAEIEKNDTFRWYVNRFFTEDFTEEEIKTAIIDFFIELRSLNVLTYYLKYRKHYVGTLDNEIKEGLIYIQDRKDFKIVDLKKIYKELKSVQYQIELEHLEGLRDLTTKESLAIKFLESLINYAALVIANEVTRNV